MFYRPKVLATLEEDFDIKNNVVVRVIIEQSGYLREEARKDAGIFI